MQYQQLQWACDFKRTLTYSMFSLLMLVLYVALYMVKTDRATAQLLKQVAAEARTEELKQQVGSAFFDP